MLEQLHHFDHEEWKRIECQFNDHYTATYNFVTENRGSVLEAKDVYREAFVYYTQLLELDSMKLAEKASDIIYSFSRKLWLLKLEKRKVDLNFVKHRREYYEMEEAFHSIDSINKRSAKTAEKLAEIGEPHRTIMLECIGRRKAIGDIAPRFGFSDEDRAFQQLSRSVKQLVKLMEGKEVEANDLKFAALLRYVLDNPTGDGSTLMEGDKFNITMISRVVAMIRSHVTRSTREEKLRKLQEKQLEPKISPHESKSETNSRKMKPVLVFSITALIAVVFSAVTSFTLSSGSLMSIEISENDVPVIESLADTTVFISETVAAPAFVATAFAIAPNGYFITTASTLSDATSVDIVHPEDGSNYKMEVVYKDSVADIAILFCADEGVIFNVPYRFNPSALGVGESVYALGISNEKLLYSDGSISFSQSNGLMGARVGDVAPGTAVVSPNGQLAGMAVSSADGITNVLETSTLNEIFLRAEAQRDIDLKVPQRNKLFFLERPQQIAAMKECIYMVKVFY